MNTGHVKQVAAFEKLLGFCNAQGAKYNPSKATLNSTALNSLLSSAQQSLKAVVDARTDFLSARNQRSQAFDGLPKLMTRVVNTMMSSGASPAGVADAYGYIRKFRPSSKARAKTASPPAADAATPPATHSSSQLDFDSRATNFEAFVGIVANEPSYAPNEPELQLQVLQTLATELHNQNSAVIRKQVALSNALKQRNQLLYDAAGIYDVAKSVKQYTKGAFGFQSAAYHQISSLYFRKLN